MSKFYDNLKNHSLNVIAGPCVLESRDHSLYMAEELNNFCLEHGVNFIYKTSFDKANRTSNDSYRGEGLDAAMYIFDEIKKNIGCEILTDVHEDWQAEVINADILQIPAFLCRQTNLLKTAGATKKPINIKKGQFVSPNDISFAVEKIESVDNDKIMLTERGTFFGYGDLVVDFRSIPIMKEIGYPVVMDCTHSVQQPSALGGKSGGKSVYAPMMAYLGALAGANVIFAEVHNDPKNAPSDGPNMLTIDEFRDMIMNLFVIKEAQRNFK